MNFGLTAQTDDAVALTIVEPDQFGGWLEAADDHARSWTTANDYRGQADKACVIPTPDGRIDSALIGMGDSGGCYGLAAGPSALPPGRYRLTHDMANAEALCLGWGLAHYRFGRYQAVTNSEVELIWPEGVDRQRVEAMLRAHYLLRDLINTPAGDMGPVALAEAARNEAEAFGAEFVEVIGEALLDQRFPAIHAVGRAAAEAPRLVDMRWGDTGPRVTIVGKGVCFDSGGLDIKGASGMRWMKKDMGGAAHALALGRLLMETGAPLRLRVLLPIVENAISGNAYRPGDVVPTRSGRTVEIGNTDAEGRVVLCDALTLAAEEEPDTLIDFATLTGAARVALGPDLPALFANDDTLANQILEGGERWTDPVWRLPLHAGYRSMLDSPIADINNTATGGFGGAITAALYLQSFVPNELNWAHVDTFAWNKGNRPGRPEGAEALGLRAAFGAIEARIAT